MVKRAERRSMAFPASQGPCPRPARRQKHEAREIAGFVHENPGSVLLSHTASRAVPSAPRSLTSEFGKGSGVASSRITTGNFG